MTTVLHENDYDFLSKAITFGLYTPDHYARSIKPFDDWKAIYLDEDGSLDRTPYTQSIRRRASKLATGKNPFLSRIRLATGILGYLPTPEAKVLLGMNSPPITGNHVASYTSRLQDADVCQAVHRINPTAEYLSHGVTLFRAADDTTQAVLRCDPHSPRIALVQRLRFIEAQHSVAKTWCVTALRRQAETLKDLSGHHSVEVLKGVLGKFGYYHAPAFVPESLSSRVGQEVATWMNS